MLRMLTAVEGDVTVTKEYSVDPDIVVRESVGPFNGGGMSARKSPVRMGKNKSQAS
jgi:hypothetical protein